MAQSVLDPSDVWIIVETEQDDKECMRTDRIDVAPLSPSNATLMKCNDSSRDEKQDQRYVL